MTALAERTRPKSGAPFVPGQPQVNLLPPEVKAARGLKALKRVLAMLLVLVVAACAGAYVLASFDKNKAQDELASAQDDTLKLQAEIERYARVPLVRGQLESARYARQLAMSTEVLWQPYYGAITAVLPPGVSLDNLTVAQATPMTAPAAPASPIQESSIGQITFTARSATIPDTAAWVDALNSIPGLGDAWVSSAVVTQGGGESGTAFYNVSATVQIRESAYALRFAPTEETADEAAADTSEEGE